MRQYSFISDLVLVKPIEPVVYKQYDNGDTLEVELYQDQERIKLTDELVLAFFQLDDGTVIQKTCEVIDGNPIATLDNNILSIDRQIKVEFSIFEGEKVTTTRTILIDVETSIDRNNAIETIPQWDIVNQILYEGPAIILAAQEATIYANEQGNYAKTEADKLATLNDAVTDNEATRIANEQTRQVNESERLTNETDRSSAESIRVSNEDDRIASETARQDAEATRASQEAQRQTDTAGAITESQDATEAANTAALNADGKAQLAQDKVDELSGLNVEISQAITNAEAITTAAGLAAQEATSKAGLADNAATYAIAQGQRAEDAADLVEDLLEGGTVASVNGQTGIVNLTAGDVGAETPTGSQQKADVAEGNANNYTDQKIAGLPPPTPPEAENISIADEDELFIATNVEGALTELKQDDATHTAEDATNAHMGKNIGIEDADGYYTGANVEQALQEIGFIMNGMRGSLIDTYNSIVEM